MHILFESIGCYRWDVSDQYGVLFSKPIEITITKIGQVTKVATRGNFRVGSGSKPISKEIMKFINRCTLDVQKLVAPAQAGIRGYVKNNKVLFIYLPDTKW